MSEMAHPPAFDLAGRAALVTGGASGIGAACARELAARGASVTVADAVGVGGQRVAEQIGGTSWEVDLLDVTALETLHVEIDILVNNAGVETVSPIVDFPPARFRSMVVLMVEASFLLVRAALPHMHEQGFGRIVNISSVHGIRASAYKSAYVTAKHALEGPSKVIALEGAEHGMTDTAAEAIVPQWIPTPHDVSGARVTDLTRFVRKRCGVRTNDYRELWQRSVNNVPAFWRTVWDYFDLGEAHEAVLPCGCLARGATT